jgi:hypothetical protein
MTRCPKCGKEVDFKKNYKLAIKPDKTEEKTDVTFGMCDDCRLILILGMKKPHKL